MDTRQLNYFIGVIDHHGSCAADHFQMAQPSLSQSVSGFRAHRWHDD